MKKIIACRIKSEKSFCFKCLIYLLDIIWISPVALFSRVIFTVVWMKSSVQGAPDSLNLKKKRFPFQFHVYFNTLKWGNVKKIMRIASQKSFGYPLLLWWKTRREKIPLHKAPPRVSVQFLLISHTINSDNDLRSNFQLVRWSFLLGQPEKSRLDAAHFTFISIRRPVCFLMESSQFKNRYLTNQDNSVMFLICRG